MHFVILSKSAYNLSSFIKSYRHSDVLHCVILHCLHSLSILLIYIICLACYVFFTVTVVACTSINYSEYILPGKPSQSGRKEIMLDMNNVYNL